MRHSKFEACLACSLGERSDPTVVAESTAVEGDRGDPLGLGAHGQGLSHGAGGLGLVHPGQTLTKLLVQRRCLDENSLPPRGEDLGVDVSRTAVDTEPRPRPTGDDGTGSACTPFTFMKAIDLHDSTLTL